MNIDGSERNAMNDSKATITVTLAVPRNKAGLVSCEGDFFIRCPFLQGVDEYGYSCGAGVDIDAYSPLPTDAEGCPFLADAETR